MNILIVDDHAVVRKGLVQILSEQYDDLDVVEATDARGALEAVSSRALDVVVLDISMPGRSGLDVLKEIKREQPDVPVLVLSMHPEEQFAVRVLRAGASGYLTKQTAPNELVNAIRKVTAGGTYVSASLAELLAQDLQRDDGNDADPHKRLSDREYEVMLMIASGKAVSEIADELSLSVKTISTYRTRILDKIHMKSNAEITRYAITRGLVD
jgi:DNA-binding NarL/FixJ family response regulator